jgi:hypothetical protein
MYLGGIYALRDDEVDGRKSRHITRGAHKMTSRRLLGVAIGAVAAVSVISMGASAMAAPEAVRSPHPTNFRESVKPAKVVRGSARPAAGTVTHHYSLAASAFAPDGLHTTTEDYFNAWNPTTLSNTDAGRCFNAGLSLPPNVTLKSIKFYYTAGSAVMFLDLNRQDLVNHTAVNLADSDTTVESTPVYTSTSLNIKAANAVVNMTNDAYSVGVCPSGTTTFSGLTITYTQPG